MSPNDLERTFMRILDKDDSPQRYPPIPLLDAVCDILDPEHKN